MEYIFAVSTKNKDSALRNYLCEYMINVNGFKNEHVIAWNIIKFVIEHEEKYKQVYKINKKIISIRYDKTEKN